MYTFVLHLHDWLRWIILLAGFGVSGHYIWGYTAGFKRNIWTKHTAVIYVSTLHLQLLLGIALYFFLSPWTSNPWPEEWIRQAAFRLHILEHPTLMLLAVIIAQIGRSWSKRVSANQKMFGIGAIMYSLSLIILLLGIPWKS